MSQLKLSLWLRPDDPANATFQEQILRLSQRQDGSSSVSFEPHVTILGNITCDEQDLPVLLQRLEEGLRDFGSIFCQLHDRPYFAPVWSQAAVLVVQESHELCRLVQLCQDIVEPLSSESISVFPPPIGLPHLSLFYGTTNVPTEQEIQAVPNCFTASSVELWSTIPMSVKGVVDWKMMHSVRLS
jgi:hypothetical protein